MDHIHQMVSRAFFVRGIKWHDKSENETFGPYHLSPGISFGYMIHKSPEEIFITFRCPFGGDTNLACWREVGCRNGIVQEEFNQALEQIQQCHEERLGSISQSQQ